MDWWALGILIFEMLAGFSPFYGESTQDTYEKILDCNFTWPRSVISVSVSVSLSVSVCVCLELSKCG